MAKALHEDKLSEDDDFVEDVSDWSDELADRTIKAERGNPGPRNSRKWKAIEDYWENKRLRDALQDYTSDED